MTPRLTWAPALPCSAASRYQRTRFGLVLENALAVGVHETEVELGTGVTLLGGQPVPAHRFGLVLENAPPVSVHAPEVELGLSVTLLGSQPAPAHRFGLVLENASPLAYMPPRVNWALA